MHKVIREVIQTIEERSQAGRHAYICRMQSYTAIEKSRSMLSCGNLAHVLAACPLQQKNALMDFSKRNIAIITAYNDVLSAHQPYKDYPDIIKAILMQSGHSAQVAGGVPAMCDGVTQGQTGMDLSLFSRDLIAQSTALSLSHNAFDATLLLGICDKIAPGQLMGALSFGHLPTIFIPSGPMPTGIANDEKVRVRQQYAAGTMTKSMLQDMENRSYHAPGTCTFYGTANTNQLVFEAMGLMLPGSAFIPCNTPLRHALTQKASAHITSITRNTDDFRPLYERVDAHSLVNGLVALLASGGSTNHTIHLIAIAKAAGLHLCWDDFDKLSTNVPLLVRMYPNGPEDINAFEAAGGVPTLLKELAERGLFSLKAKPVFGTIEDYFMRPKLCTESGHVLYHPAPPTNNPEVIALPENAFSNQGGIKRLQGNLGQGIMKISAVAEENRYLQAPARIFESQHEVEAAYRKGLLNQDCAIIVRHNGPAANGMPELHKLMPLLGNLMNAGFKVALVTDGRLSGASGKVPAVIHMAPEAQHDGPLSLLQEGDIILIDADKGMISTLANLTDRHPFHPDLSSEHTGFGREWFNLYRKSVSRADQGATILE